VKATTLGTYNTISLRSGMLVLAPLNSYFLLMTAESVTLVLAVFGVCVCVCLFVCLYVCLCVSFAPVFFSARDRCPPANLLNLSAMY
jgi:hypothetical protein